MIDSTLSVEGLKLKNGWYSDKMAKHASAVTYRDINGKHVTVTVVSDTENHGCNWPDMQLVSNCLIEYVQKSKPIIFYNF